jgi:hypothetical protein
MTSVPSSRLPFALFARLQGAMQANRLPYRFAVVSAKDRWVAVGTSGSLVSQDDGATWTLLDQEKYNSVGCTPTGEGWAVGPKGRIAALMK